MSVNRWVSSTGDWSNTAGWHNSDVPDSADSAFLCNNGAVAVSSGLSQSAIDLDDLIVTDFANNIGSSGSPLIIGAGTFQFIGNTGEIYITNHSGVTNTWLINSTSRKTISLTGTATYNRIVVIRGNVTITGNGSTIIDLLQIGYHTNELRDAVVNLDSCVVTSCMQSGGTLNAASCEILEHYKAGGNFYGTGTHVGTSDIMWHSGGLYDRRLNAAMAAIYAGGGNVDLTHNIAPWTLSALARLPGAKVSTNPQVVTIMNTYDVENELAYGPQP